LLLELVKTTGRKGDPVAVCSSPDSMKGVVFLFAGQAPNVSDGAKIYTHDYDVREKQGEDGKTRKYGVVYTYALTPEEAAKTLASKLLAEAFAEASASAGPDDAKAISEAFNGRYAEGVALVFKSVNLDRETAFFAVVMEDGRLYQGGRESYGEKPVYTGRAVDVSELPERLTPDAVDIAGRRYAVGAKANAYRRLLELYRLKSEVFEDERLAEKILAAVFGGLKREEALGLDSPLSR
jgi:hypothetical protein